jgi:FtsP/CotA-like multicopper oxidase with cupredoxin domain
LPLFLTNNPLPDGYPWGKLTDWGNNPYLEYPKTGVVRYYELTVSRGFVAPDGYVRDVLLVNGAYPGPLIEANWGDTIVVDVHNNITGPEDGTAIHWHGFLQHETPWEDGAPGISQCPIPPRRSYRYEFIASLYGTTWYHAHYSAQYTGGVLGPLVVHGPSQEKYDIDLGPIMLSGEFVSLETMQSALGAHIAQTGTTRNTLTSSRKCSLQMAAPGCCPITT